MKHTAITNADVLEASALKLIHAYLDIHEQAKTDKNTMLYASTALNGGTAPWHVAHVGKQFEATRREFLQLAKAQSAKMLQQETASFVSKLDNNQNSFDANAYLEKLAEDKGISLPKDTFIVPVGNLGIAA